MVCQCVQRIAASSLALLLVSLLSSSAGAPLTSPPIDHAIDHQKMYSIGDLHGDYEHFKLIMQGLGLATFEDDHVKWTGGNAILVSTGDTVDRGTEARKIYLAFNELYKQAPQQGGEIVNILGNHELMNLQNDLRYVAEDEYEDYGGEAKRKEAWARDGLHSEIRSRYLAVAKRKDVLFVHAGLEPAIIRRYGHDEAAIERLNAEVKKTLLESEVVTMNHALFDNAGPFWTRTFAYSPEGQACRKVEETLSIVGAHRMVIGHTPQSEVATRCQSMNGPKIILADTGISEVYFSRPSAVEYDGNQVTALYFREGKDAERVTIHDGKQLGVADL